MSITGTLRKYGAAAALAAATAVAAPAFAAPAQAAPAQAAELPYGQDVSNWQPTHDWAASGAEFGIVKATQGLHFKDKTFARHWQELDKHGVVRGAYHFGHPKNDPVAEADFFLSVVESQPAKKGDLLALDLETTDGKSAEHVNKWAKTFMERVKAKTGVTPLFYSGFNFADKYGKGLAEYPLWVAHYGKAKGTVGLPADWKSWAIHQYSESPVDQNVSSLTLDQLRSLGRS
ncbi:MAG TPA: GH25 family lysozyme [Nonomuraea sp.]|nr:GH25 family lysozyme [Nonomuraea sp.]